MAYPSRSVGISAKSGPGAASSFSGAAIAARTFAGNGTTLTKNALTSSTVLTGDSYDNCLFDTDGYTGSVVPSIDIFSPPDNYLAGSGSLEIQVDGVYALMWMISMGGQTGSGTWDADYFGYLYATRGASSMRLDSTTESFGSWRNGSLFAVKPHGGGDFPLLAGDFVELRAHYSGTSGAQATTSAYANLYLQKIG